MAKIKILRVNMETLFGLLLQGEHHYEVLADLPKDARIVSVLPHRQIPGEMDMVVNSEEFAETDLVSAPSIDVAIRPLESSRSRKERIKD